MALLAHPWLAPAPCIPPVTHDVFASSLAQMVASVCPTSSNLGSCSPTMRTPAERAITGELPAWPIAMPRMVYRELCPPVYQRVADVVAAAIHASPCASIQVALPHAELRPERFYQRSHASELAVWDHAWRPVPIPAQPTHGGHGRARDWSAMPCTPGGIRSPALVMPIPHTPVCRRSVGSGLASAQAKSPSPQGPQATSSRWSITNPFARALRSRR